MGFIFIVLLKFTEAVKKALCFLGSHAWSIDWSVFPTKLKCSRCLAVAEIVRS